MLWLDIETYSSVDLRTAGVYRYSESPDFEVMMCGWSNGDPVRVAVGEDEIRAIPGIDDPGIVKVAHNAPFERVCFSRFFGLPTGKYLPTTNWIDTQTIAGLAGLPQSLDGLAKALGATEKDRAGTALINLFSKPRRGRRVLPEEYPEKWQAFIRYCGQDVETLIEVHQLLPMQDLGDERAVWETDQAINDRGIRADLALAQLAVDADEANRQRDETELRILLQIENAGSVKQITEGLEAFGARLPNLRADTVTEHLEQESNPKIRRALELRQQIALVASKKFTAAINSASSDGRIRGGFRYFGAHTGRWSGRGVQLQNMPREKVDHPDAAILDLGLGFGADATTLKALVRSMLVGPFTVVDYSQIEARTLAWLAGERWALEAFAAGRDIYTETAQRMGGLTRQQGKVAVLASGYQGGIVSLRNMGAVGTDDQLQGMVNRWRKANPKIVRLWSAMEQAFRAGGELGRLTIERRQDDRALVLPSGRAIVYHKVRPARDITFTDHRGNRADTYGGRLVENAVQAISRDILADAMVRLERQGYRTVLHAHDEIVVEGTPGVEPMVKLMCDRPLWADDLPLAAEGFTCERYTK